VAGGADYKPTDTEVGLVHDDEEKLAQAETDYKNLMTKEVPSFNRVLTEHNVTPIATAGTPPTPSAADDASPRE
jgi:hypothetical protein